MYARLWAKLPGPFAARLAITVVVVLVVVAVLFTVVFPWVNARLPIDNTGTESPQAAAAQPEGAA